MQLIILRGAPGSGKSTFAEIWAREPNRVRVNRDNIRHALYGVWHGGNVDEDLITKVEDAIIEQALKANVSVVVDDCNVNRRYVKRFAELGNKYNADVQVKVFNPPLKVCLERNANRDRKVPEGVIKDMYNRLQNSLNIELAKVDVESYIPDITKPDAVIFDVDNTLAKKCDRSPYDYTRVSEDSVVEAIADLARMEHLFGNRVLVLSGREDSCMLDTYDWLKNNDVPFDELHMRKTGDFRKDWVIKLELFNQFIRNNYNVLRAYDDRDQMIWLYRTQLKIPTLQVEYGDF